MKRILALVPFLCLVLGAASQESPWPWHQDSNGAQDRTVVFADLVVNGDAVPLSDVGSRYLIGAFIDNECRGMAEVMQGAVSWMQIEVYGNYDRTDDNGKPISFRLYDKTNQVDLALNSSRQVVWDQTSYGSPSSDHVVLSVWLDTDDAVITYPASVTLSKLRDVQLHLTHTNANQTVVAPNQVSITIADGPKGWTAATATGAGLEWTLRGLAVGEYDYYVTYNGKRMPASDGNAVGRLIIPAEVNFENGWDWISIFMPTPYALTNASTGDFLSTLNMDRNNRIIEIRSQLAALYNDPTGGLFGDITQLSASDGAYKIKSNYEDRNATTKIFNLGTAANGTTTAAQMPMVEPGYTWIGYPHEQYHKLATLMPYLAATATAGDLIIGRDAFIEFDGLNWVGSLQSFEPGKGYIYYTENDTPFRLNWGDYYLPLEAADNVAPAPTPWYYDARQYASTMPIVATLDQDTDPTRYSIGAFVGDECRGQGTVGSDGKHLFITVTGNPGENISFKLYDKATGSFTDLDETLLYGNSAGSLQKPVVFNTNPSKIQTNDTEKLSLTYARQTITVNGANAALTITVTDMLGHTMLISHNPVTSLESLPRGVYLVNAKLNAKASKTIKITK